MRTTVDLDENVVKEGVKLTRLKTKNELMSLALFELIERRKRKSRLISLEGKMKWEGDLEQMRRTRT